MKSRLKFAKWFLAAIPVLVPPSGTASFGPGLAKITPTLDRSLRHCEQYPWSVLCDRDATPGGPIGCFDTLCDAAAAGASHCKPTSSACEPH
jgi:hypothetical protein